MSPNAMQAEKGRTWQMPRAPSKAVYEAATPAERERMEQEILDAIEAMREAMSEGTRHSRPKSRALVELEAYFKTHERRIFLATELAVFYPDEQVFVPDIVAVLDVDPDRELTSWTVLREGRGLDLAIEFHHLGKRHKDIEENVRLYARLGIQEYFTFEVLEKRLRGFRLPPGGRNYLPILGQKGRLASEILSLELGLVDGRLRFYDAAGQLPETAELIARLDRMVSDLLAAQQRADAAQQRADDARRLLDAERQRADAERQRADAERQRADAAEAALRELQARLSRSGAD